MIDPHHIWNVIYNARSNKQILRLPGKMTLMIDPHRIWNVIYNEQSNRHHAPTSPNIAPVTQNESHDWSTSHMKRHLQMRGATVNTLQPHQILRLPRKMNLMIDPHHIWNVIYKCAEQQSTPSYLTKYCACQAKWISGLIRITYETSFTMRGATGITLQPHHILRLPRKMKRISNARSNKRQPPTSPNTAPATQNECHLWSASYMKRHFQCAEQAKSPFKLTKYCACHQILSSRFDREISELLPPIERRFEHIPTISDDNPTQNRHLAPAASEAFAVWSWRRFWIGKYKFTRSGYLLKMSRSAAPATKSHSQTSPNSVLARQNECHQWSASHMKRHFQCAEQAKSPSNLTKYCACHAKWISWLIGVT